MKQIKLTLNKKTGELQIETSGYVGGECQTDPAVVGLKQGLGMTENTSCQLKPEFFETKVEEQQSVGGGE